MAKTPKFDPDGKRRNKSGYVLVSIPGRPNSAFEHRVVMERHLGRPLLSVEHIHHINGIKDDNRVENLEIVTTTKHGQRHATILARNCPRCGIEFTPDHQKTRYCSISCANRRGDDVPCAECGKMIHKKPSRRKQYARAFCGVDCLNAYRAKHWANEIDWDIAVQRRLAHRRPPSYGFVIASPTLSAAAGRIPPLRRSPESRP